MAPGVEMEVSMESNLSVLFTTEVPDPDVWGPESQGFTVGDISYFLRMFTRNDGRTFDLYLVSGHVPSSSFHLTAYLSKGTELFLPQTTTVRHDWRYVIWSRNYSEVSKVDRVILQQKSWTFKVIVHLAGQATSDNKLISSPFPASQLLHLEALSRDYGKLLVDGGDSCDVRISCGGQVFKAHGCVLSVRSVVFAAMLQNNMAESATGEVQIDDVEKDVFRPFLRYLYTGVLPELTAVDAQRLYEVADKYAVSELRKACATFLCYCLTKENACGLLVLSDRHSDRDFKDAVVQYMVKEKVPRTAQNWSDFCDRHPRLANEVLNRFCEFLASQ